MKKTISKIIVCVMGIGFMMTANGFSQSLYEELSKKSKAELTRETTQMSEKIQKTFDQSSMEKSQQKIHFYEYFSNLKKLVLYGSKLANYSAYEEDLTFAKENELFKGLPEEKPEDKPEKRTRYVKEKYSMMKTNIKDEIDTYTDLIQYSLDACEHLSLYSLTQESANDKNMKRIRYYMENSRDYQEYLAKKEKLAKAWPGLEAGIQRQFDLWQERGLAPEDPVVDPRITKEIVNNVDAV